MEQENKEEKPTEAKVEVKASAAKNPVKTEKRRYSKTRVGIVVSNKMEKTVVVEVTRLIKHPRYGKYLKRHKKFKAHDEKQTAKLGDKVMIKEVAPISKSKCWKVSEVLST